LSIDDARSGPRVLRLVVPTVLEAVEPARREILAFIADRDPPADLRYRLELVLEETLMNRVMHAASPTPTALSVAFDGDVLVLTFVDAGVPFDPLAPPSPRGDAPGGLGLMLTRRAATACSYARKEGRNVFTVRLASRAVAAPDRSG
jgi:anti-sigma regulatory factor (Ser/Thr protein kinase)